MLCELHKGSKGFRPRGPHADRTNNPPPWILHFELFEYLIFLKACFNRVIMKGKNLCIKGCLGSKKILKIKTDLWSQMIRILHNQKNGRSGKGSFTMTTACSCASRGEKKYNKNNNKTYPHGEDQKKKQHKLRMNIRNVYISVWNTNVSRIEYTPKDSKIIKNLKLKPIYFFFNYL